MTEEILERLTFHMIFYKNPGAWRRVRQMFANPGEVFQAGQVELEKLNLPRSVIKEVVSGKAIEKASQELEKIKQKRYIFLSFEDPGYPELLREIADPPPFLYCSGKIDALTQPAVAVVGSRKPSPYGKLVAERLSHDLASRGCVIVSGLAAGIDAIAHWGALSAGRTVAVLGSGLDVIYPRENRRLAEKIMDNGIVISEFPLGTKPLRENFPMRNRIISGLSLGVIVVEAARRSGSLISARFALDQNREVMAVPGNVTNEMSKGSNGLIKDGAKLVEDWQDVADGLPSPWREKLLAQNDDKMENIQVLLSQEEKRLLDLVPADDCIHIDELLDKTDYSSSGLLAVLLDLELKEVVVQRTGKYYQRRV